MLTSNKGRDEWGNVRGDEIMATALIDRLLHHCHIVNIRGHSYRMREHQDWLRTASDERRGRLLALHAADSYRERGGAVTLRVGDGARQPGLTLSLSPRWGAPATASDALWRDQLFHRRTAGAPGGRRDERALDGRVDYGLPVPAGGLLTPFGIYGQSPSGRRLQVGLLLSRFGPVELEASGERYALRDPNREDYRISALGRITVGGADHMPAGRSAVQ